MKSIKDTSITGQLITTFVTIALFLGIIGLLFGFQSRELYRQTQAMHDHPLQVRRAISNLKVDILTIQLAVKDLVIATDEYEQHTQRQIIAAAKNDAHIQFDVLRDFYLGPADDVKFAYEHYSNWLYTYESTLSNLEDNMGVEARSQALDERFHNEHLNLLNIHIARIDSFSRDKSDELLKNAYVVRRSMILQLVFIIMGAITFVGILSLLLIIRIRTPLKKLNDGANKFAAGDLSVQVIYEGANEFGVLTESLNNLMGAVQSGIMFEEKRSEISRMMIQQVDDASFFRDLLTCFIDVLDAQMGAVYIQESDYRTYSLLFSVGLSEGAPPSYNAESFDGELGLALARHKIQHLKDISSNCRIVHRTLIGDLLPQEMVCIPVITQGNVVAVIFLASLKTINEKSVSLLKSMQDMINAKAESVLAHRKVIEYSTSVANQNKELDIQRKELSAQTEVLKEQNSELEIQKERLKEINTLKSSFMSNLSHELRTPLNSVIALSGVLKRRLNSKVFDKEYGYLEIIEKNSKSLLGLINDILDISRINAGKEKVDIMTFNLKENIENIITMIEPLAKDKHLSISVEGPEELLITSDENKVGHILQNLLSNAVKYTEQGSIEVNFKTGSEGVHIQVKDTGIGVLPDQLSLIFDEFQQVGMNNANKHGSTGLGLSIARKYAELLGGRLFADSEYGRGSVFTLILPKVLEIRSNTYLGSSVFGRQKNSLSTKYTNFKKGNNAAKNILVVEDNEPAIIQIEDLLFGLGYKTKVARNGIEALKAINREIPDGIVLDLMIPQVDGFSVLEELREFSKDVRVRNIPILLLTAKDITEEESEFIERCGVNRVIQKGYINRDGLNNALNSMFSERHMNNPWINDLDILKDVVKEDVRNRRRILVVEDNLDNIVNVRALLEDHYDIKEAHDGLSGVDAAKHYEPDLILMDIALPEIDGIEAFRRIRNTPGLSHIPVIALTASALTQDRETIMGNGFDGFVAKPIIDNNLYDVIERVLKSCE